MQNGASFAKILHEDLELYPRKSGAFTQQTYADNELSPTQRLMEETVGQFLVDDATEEDDAMLEEDA